MIEEGYDDEEDEAGEADTQVRYVRWRWYSMPSMTDMDCRLSIDYLPLLTCRGRWPALVKRNLQPLMKVTYY